ncbi:hypothetical protein HK405_016050, partial [Cladochytrium tenue]
AAFGRLALSCAAPDAHTSPEIIRALQKAVFSNSLEALLFDDAHVALMALPDIEIQRVCLRRFVTVVCEHGAAEDLCARYAFGPIQPEVEEILSFKARTRPVVPVAPSQLPRGVRHPNPNYHAILYAYYVLRGAHKKASVIMYDYAHRLGAVTAADVAGESLLPVITEQVKSYLASITALYIIPEKEQWIIYRTSGTALRGQVAKKRRTAYAQEPAYGQDDSSAGRTPSGSRSEIIRLGEMRREYALALSKLSLAERYREYEVVAGLPDPSDLIALHVHDGDFDSAISLGRAFGTGLRHAFAVLAQRAVDLSLLEAGRREVPPAPVQIEEMPGVRGSPAT